MNATGLWPVNTLRRYMSFFALFRASRDALFASHETQEGTYHGPEVRTVMNDMPPTTITQKDIDEMSDDSDDSVDGDF